MRGDKTMKMKTKELIKALQTMPNAEVLVYIGEEEEYGNVQQVSLITDDNAFPYSKGDKPKLGPQKYHEDRTNEIVLIKGTLTN